MGFGDEDDRDNRSTFNGVKEKLVAMDWSASPEFDSRLSIVDIVSNRLAPCRFSAFSSKHSVLVFVKCCA